MQKIEEWKQQEKTELFNYLMNIAKLPYQERKEKITKDKISKEFQELIRCYGTMEEKVNKIIEDHYTKLQNKVKAKIGDLIEITDRGNGYNYIFKGTESTCEVELITAGGYNIQRKHTRWIIK